MLAEDVPLTEYRRYRNFIAPQSIPSPKAEPLNNGW
jgi:hypothetical protein